MSNAPDADQRRVADQSQYEEATADTRWVELEEGPGWFQVREVAPLKLLRDMRKHGVSGLLGGDDADEQSMGEVVADGSFEAFLEQTILPNIIQPNCYWDTDDDTIGDAAADFDLASLEPEDLMNVITAMTGQDQDDLNEQMDETFRGEPDSPSGPSGR